MTVNTGQLTVAFFHFVQPADALSLRHCTSRAPESTSTRTLVDQKISLPLKLTTESEVRARDVQCENRKESHTNELSKEGGRHFLFPNSLFFHPWTTTE